MCRLCARIRLMGYSFEFDLLRTMYGKNNENGTATVATTKMSRELILLEFDRTTY